MNKIGLKGLREGVFYNHNISTSKYDANLRCDWQGKILLLIIKIPILSHAIILIFPSIQSSPKTPG